MTELVESVNAMVRADTAFTDAAKRKVGIGVMLDCRIDTHAPARRLSQYVFHCLVRFGKNVRRERVIANSICAIDGLVNGRVRHDRQNRPKNFLSQQYRVSSRSVDNNGGNVADRVRREKKGREMNSYETKEPREAKGVREKKIHREREK